MHERKENQYNHDLKRLLIVLKTNFCYVAWLAVYFILTVLSFKDYDVNIFIVIYLVSGLYVFSIAIALLFGESIYKLLERVRPVETKREKEYLHPIFEEVYDNVKNMYPALPKIKPHIIDSLTINAIAIGKHTVAITQGAIETLSADELKGIIAHEISHIYHGDTMTVIINTIGNGIFTLQVIMIKAFMRLFEYFTMVMPDKAMTNIIRFIRFIFELYIIALLCLGNIILSFHKRGFEYRADKFAYKCGYGEQLIQALYIIQKLNLGNKADLLTRMKASHPRISKRIALLENLIDSEQ